MKDELSLSVVIPCGYTSRIPNVSHMVNSLMSSDEVPDEILLVVDDTDAAKMILDLSIPARVIYAPDAKPMTDKRNEGAKYATGDIVAFLDDDEIPDKEWVKNIKKIYREYKPIVVGGKVITENAPQWLPNEFLWLVGGTTFPGHVHEVRNTWGGNTCILREILDTVQFDEHFGNNRIQGEDVMICSEIERKTGKRALYTPDIIVYHYPDENKMKFWYLLKRAYWQGVTKKVLVKQGCSLGEEKDHLTTIVSNTQNYLKSPRKLFVLCLFTCAVGVGYLRGGKRKTGSKASG